MTFKLLNKPDGRDPFHTTDLIASFLHEHLQEYGDDRQDILRALNYVFDDIDGGIIVLALEGSEIVGTVVINRTGMSGYIPDNVLVYIAVHGEHRGRGLGAELMRQTIKATQGDIALHVEPGNPAVHLYRKMGFENPYLEMRLKKH